ncbi:hypothetical protein KD909_15110 (plasmid) [Exiguobacterium sp. PFWT01]|uniref:hypothetical protein n=1 Tax=Exiguobacterium sp. PFWT01 TaxID=2829816 RepID=UPI001BA9B792|nr:hypothetical protein [Exiguobacterium sp. PFWT01]QUP88690.1 hypothetical protein KD909_15110 [Exiguobacterium sp. PFWT01]
MARVRVIGDMQHYDSNHPIFDKVREVAASVALQSDIRNMRTKVPNETIKKTNKRQNVAKIEHIVEFDKAVVMTTS